MSHEWSGQPLRWHASAPSRCMCKCHYCPTHWTLCLLTPPVSCYPLRFVQSQLYSLLPSPSPAVSCYSVPNVSCYAPRSLLSRPHCHRARKPKVIDSLNERGRSQLFQRLGDLDVVCPPAAAAPKSEEPRCDSTEILAPTTPAISPGVGDTVDNNSDTPSVP